jgi:hypothetical protein
MSAATNPRPVTALLDAAEGLVAAGQQAVLDRVELIRAEATEDAREMLISTAAFVTALVVSGFGWVLLVVALSLFLSKFMDPALAVALVGVPHMVLGVVLARMTIRRFQKHQWAALSIRAVDAEATDA